MYFKLTYLLNGMHSRREADLPVTVQTSADNIFTFWTREVNHEGKIIRNFCCDLVLIRNPPKRVSDTLSALLENRLLLDSPIQVGLPSLDFDGALVDIDGNIRPNWSFPFDLLPSGAKPWLLEITKEMSETLGRFVKAFRWTQRSSGSHQPFSHVGNFWSQDSLSWHNMPSQMASTFEILQGVDLSHPATALVADLQRQYTREPFAHELIREANGICNSAPRSALLISFSALETGIKTYLKSLLPGVEDFMEKVQSPSVQVMLNQVIPDVLRKKKIHSQFFPLSRPATEYLMKWLTQRNQVAHGTKQNVNSEELRDFIRFATDIIYLIDVGEGHDWATNNLKSPYWVTIEL